MRQDDDSETGMLVVTGGGPSFSGHLLIVHDPVGSARIEVVDHLGSHILPAGDFVFRVVPCEPSDPAGSELFVYDHAGVLVYRRLPGLIDSHAFAWDGRSIVVPNTYRNQLVWISPDATIQRTWQAPTEAVDSWHINGVAVAGDRVVASAFGRFPDTRAYADADMRGQGIVFDPQTGVDVIDGLSCPHNPVYIGGEWLVCDSLPGALLAIDPAGRRTRSVVFGRWTRGLAVDDLHMYVGLSAQRYDPEDHRGAIAIVDRATWQVQRVITLPCKEVNTVAILPPEFAAPLRRGYRTNTHRVHIQDADELYRLVGSVHPQGRSTAMMPLDALDCRVDLRANMRRVVRASEPIDATISILNRGPRTLLSVPPNPVHVGFRVLDHNGATIGELDDRRGVLLEPIAPGEIRHIQITFAAPDVVGSYEVQFTLVQEWVRWFDEADVRNRVSAPLRVEHAKRRSVA